MSSSSCASSTAGPSCARTTPSITKKESRVEIPSHTESDTNLPHIVLPAQPPVAYGAYHQPHTTPNALDDFFGASVPDAHHSTSRTRISMPPPYAPYGHEVVEVQQGVYAVQEPRTLARMLFFYGFCEFPFQVGKCNVTDFLHW